MKKINQLVIILMFSGFSIFAKSQDKIMFTKEDIIGRWLESKRIEGDSIIEITENPDTYIFRDNMVFHKGESAEGVIIFNVAGRYVVEDNHITVYYKNYLEKDAGKQEYRKLEFEVLFLNDKKTEIQLLVRDYDYEYKIILNK